MGASEPNRLAPVDPWTIVAEAEAQRGPIIARWLTALIARVWTTRQLTVGAS